MESAAEMGDQGHPHIQAEFSMGFILRVVGERFTNSSRRRMAANPDGGELPELFISDSALPSTS